MLFTILKQYITFFFSDVQLYGTASRGEKVDKTSYQFEGNKTFLKITSTRDIIHSFNCVSI